MVDTKVEDVRVKTMVVEEKVVVDTVEVEEKVVVEDNSFLTNITI